jgi:hypothetical protein
MQKYQHVHVYQINFKIIQILVHNINNNKKIYIQVLFKQDLISDSKKTLNPFK